MADIGAIEQRGQGLIKQFEALDAEQGQLNKQAEQLRAQLMENQAVEGELKILDEDAEVFKSMGPVLVKVDLPDAKAMVKQRLDRLQSEIDRLDKTFKEKETAKNKLQQEIGKLQQEVAQIQQKQQQSGEEE
ncbi:Prefoldin subunit 6 [Hondaea fermentalgiana]|uniref:Prefoldin subunit 6 n=1 Tax=Hondaea fermentalgiana TaxID=2315210 RepID=A0A2R5GBI2_9STRA|nr:Prefoldin subunit 6 [Hondaea fermentalgiana]|eukprot:GBG27068.1 Prefoldin subunit 6 [Hondaea fermentalgiana]